MDKSGSVAKAIVAAPKFEPVKRVEFGCEHVQEFMNQSSEVAEKLTNSYSTLNSMLSKPLETQTTKDPKDSSKLSITTLKPTFLCLMCAAISSAEDRDAHCEAKKHPWAIESRSGCLWCGICEDFVYDPYFERLRVDQEFLTANGKKKRKLSAIYPQGDEDKFVVENANALSCQAGAPRGIYNLGQTCYLSVILQAMIHNPLMRNYFLSSRHDTADCQAHNCIACALTVSFTDIFATEKVDGHGPVDMLHKSWINAPDNLSGYSQHDAHEYYQSLVDHLHRSSDCANRKDSKKCDCLYHQIFYGKTRSTITCLSCRNITITDDTIVDLPLDLPKQASKKRKLDAKESPMKGSGDKSPLELTHCLKDFTTPEKLAEYNCQSPECAGKSSSRGKKHVTIKALPATLCILLKRFEHSGNSSQKVDTKMAFPLQLDMSPYTTRAHNKKKKGGPANQDPGDLNPVPLSARSPGWYDLSTIVIHNGKMDGGHYICYCKRDNQWFKFDDSKVTLATESQVMNTDPYLLFYIIRGLGGTSDKDPEKVKENGKRKEQNGNAGDGDGD